MHEKVLNISTLCYVDKNLNKNVVNKGCFLKKSVLTLRENVTYCEKVNKQ